MPWRDGISLRSTTSSQRGVVMKISVEVLQLRPKEEAGRRIGWRESVWEIVQKVLRSFASSLRVVVIGSCVVSGAYWSTEVMRVLSVVTRVMGWCETCEVDLGGYFQGSLGVSLDGVEEEAVDSEDSFKLWEASVLIEVHEIDS